MKVTEGSIILLTDAEHQTSAPTMEELLTAQKVYQYCRKVATSVGRPGSTFPYVQEGLLVRKSEVDGAIQLVVTVELQPKLLKLSN